MTAKFNKNQKLSNIKIDYARHDEKSHYTIMFYEFARKNPEATILEFILEVTYGSDHSVRLVYREQNDKLNMFINCEYLDKTTTLSFEEK